MKAIKILEKLKKDDRNLSDWICCAIEHLGKEQEEQEEMGSKIDHYVIMTPQETELDIAPRIHEPITEQYLKQLSPKDVGRLRKMVYYNKELLDKYVDSLESLEVIKKRIDRGE
jgi:hypothetical protein